MNTSEPVAENNRHSTWISASVFKKHLRWNNKKAKMSRGWFEEVIKPFLEAEAETGRVWMDKSCVRLTGCKRNLDTYVAYLSCREVAGCKATFRIRMKNRPLNEPEVLLMEKQGRHCHGEVIGRPLYTRSTMHARKSWSWNSRKMSAQRKRWTMFWILFPSRKLRHWLLLEQLTADLKHVKMPPKTKWRLF